MILRCAFSHSQKSVPAASTKRAALCRYLPAAKMMGSLVNCALKVLLVRPRPYFQARFAAHRHCRSWRIAGMTRVKVLLPCAIRKEDSDVS